MPDNPMRSVSYSITLYLSIGFALLISTHASPITTTILAVLPTKRALIKIRAPAFAPAPSSYHFVQKRSAGIKIGFGITGLVCMLLVVVSLTCWACCPSGSLKSFARSIKSILRRKGQQQQQQEQEQPQPQEGEEGGGRRRGRGRYEQWQQRRQIRRMQPPEARAQSRLPPHPSTVWQVPQLMAINQGPSSGALPPDTIHIPASRGLSQTRISRARARANTPDTDAAPPPYGNIDNDRSSQSSEPEPPGYYAPYLGS